MGTGRRMAHDHHRYPKLLAEVLDDDGCRPRPGDPVIAAHTAALVNQKCYSKVDGLGRKPGIAKHPAVVAVERVLIQPFPDQEPGLLPALALITQSGADASLETF